MRVVLGHDERTISIENIREEKLLFFLCRENRLFLCKGSFFFKNIGSSIEKEKRRHEEKTFQGFVSKKTKIKQSPFENFCIMKIILVLWNTNNFSWVIYKQRVSSWQNKADDNLRQVYFALLEKKGFFWDVWASWFTPFPLTFNEAFY